MDTTPEVGDWVRRVYEDRRYRNTKWHYVESVVDGDPVTRCGRRLERRTDALAPNSLEAVHTMPLTRAIGQPQLCKGGCDVGDPVDEPGEDITRSPGVGI